MPARTVSIVRFNDDGPDETVRTSDVTGWSESKVGKLVDGMSINLDHQHYYVTDSADTGQEV